MSPLSKAPTLGREQTHAAEIAAADAIAQDLRSRMNGTGNKIHLVLMFQAAYADRDAEEQRGDAFALSQRYLQDLLDLSEPDFTNRIKDAIEQTEKALKLSRGNIPAAKSILQQRGNMN